MDAALRSGELARAVLSRLIERGETLATCESLTGGSLGATITAVPGASAVYRGGLITYATDLKATLARVDSTTLEQHGAVAAPTAQGMAAGAARVCGADWGVATTGVAGPDPQEGHRPGTVFVAVFRVGDGSPEDRVEELTLSGDRAEIRRASVDGALRMLAAQLG